MLGAADLEPVRLFHRQYHDHKKCKVCKEGIAGLNRQLSLMKEYKHFPLALAGFAKLAFHPISEFPYQFHVLQWQIQLQCDQGLHTVMHPGT